MPLKADTILDILSEIAEIDVNDGLSFKMNSLRPIRETHHYDCFRVKMVCTFGPMVNYVFIDVSTGDPIVPHPIEYNYPCLLSDNKFKVLAYSFETVIAEKLSSILSRQGDITRFKDFYDFYLLNEVYKADIDLALLNQAIIVTFKSRNLLDNLKQYKRILTYLRVDGVVTTQWEHWIQNTDYMHGSELQFSSIIDCVESLLNSLDFANSNNNL